MGDTESIRKYRFRERTDFLVFLEENRSLFIDRKIKGFYNGTAFGYGSDSPVVLEFDGHCVMFDYLFLSSIKIAVFPAELFDQDNTLNFLYWDIPESRKLYHPEFFDSDFPFYDCVIEDVQLDGFSQEFEINPSGTKTRPSGGDYFSVIRFLMDNGDAFCICAAPATCDGYVDTWAESDG